MARSCSMLWLAFLLMGTCFPARGQEKALPKQEQLQRLAAVCKIWGSVRYQHPYLAYKNIDWDAALIEALPKIEAANSPKEFAEAVQNMLAVLQDPVTRVVRLEPPGQARQVPVPKAKPGDGKWFTRPTEGILAIDVSILPDFKSPYASPNVYSQQITELWTEIGKARGLIVDCRNVQYVSRPLVEHVLWLACAQQLQSIGTRRVVHSGYKTQTGLSSGSYYSACEVESGDAILVSPKHKAPKSVWLLNARFDAPDIALASQHAGDGYIVVQGKASADMVVPQSILPLIEGFSVLLRTGERVTPEGEAFAFQPDAEVAPDGDPGTDGPAYQAALTLLKGAKPGKGVNKEGLSQTLPSPVWLKDRSYRDMAFPEREYRLLALFRFWNVMHYFFPYKHLLDRDWNTVLPEFLPKFLAARDERDYVLAVAEMAARTQDSHTHVDGSEEIWKFKGEMPPPVALRWIEGAAVVVWLRDEKAAKTAGIRVGDVVLNVDGEPVAALIERFGKYTPVSRPGAQPLRIVSDVLLHGPDGSVCKVTLRGADGKEREVKLPRRYDFFNTGSPPPAKKGVFERLPGNLGYVDLTRLEANQIGPMLEKLKDTKALIFDMRGYPRVFAGDLASRFNVKNAKYGAMMHRPLVKGGEEEKTDVSLQRILPADGWKYQGKTAMLIDERAQSASEYTGLFLEAACGTTFIGSHTAGANGNATSLVLPGGLKVLFTGMDVRHADGRQLQRIGLVPHVEVSPTIEGIRQGKDEVLERAIKFLQEGK